LPGEGTPIRTRYHGVLIFGFGPGKAQDGGEVAPTVCPFCHNQVFLHDVTSKKSVRLYFVPVVPYGTDEYLLCPICTRGLQIDEQQRPTVEAMKGNTAAWRAGRVTDAQYESAVVAFWRRIGVAPGGGQLLRAAPAAATPAASATPVAPRSAVTPSGGTGSLADKLHELAHLHDQGLLTDEQYSHAKERTLDG
jgi:hypothetical protein